MLFVKTFDSSIYFIAFTIFVLLSLRMPLPYAFAANEPMSEKTDSILDLSL